jgi:hypothetical protein
MRPRRLKMMLQAHIGFTDSSLIQQLGRDIRVAEEKGNALSSMTRPGSGAR